MLPFLQRLRQRKIVQWALAYAAAAWLSLEVFDLVAEQFFWPVWIRQGATIFFLIGLLITIVLAWYHGERGRQKVGLVELILLIALLSLGAQSIWHLRGRDQSHQQVESSSPKPFRSEPLPANSVAVLPCLNLSRDEDQSYFADSLAAELITRLATVQSLRIPSYTSSLSFKGSQAQIKEIGIALNVRHILECDVSGDDARIRVAARLIDAESGYSVWNDSYNYTRTRLFDVQQDVAEAVVQNLEIELVGKERQWMERRWTENMEAYEEFLQAIQHQLGIPTREHLDEAQRHLERAIELDPKFGRAYARLAIHWIIVGNYQFGSPREAYIRTEQLANKAITLDKDLFEAYWALGWAEFAGNYNWLAAERNFRKTIELAPGEWQGYHSLGFVHGVLGRIGEGLEAARIAIGLNPLAFYPQVGLETLLVRQRDYSAAIKTVRHMGQVFGWNPELHTRVAGLLAMQGRHEAARVQLDRVENDAPQDAQTQLSVATVHAFLGAHEKALEIADFWESRRLHVEEPFYFGSLAVIYSITGDHERAMLYLEEAYNRPEMWMMFLDDPSFDPLRNNPRFAALIRKLKLPEDRYLSIPAPVVQSD